MPPLGPILRRRNGKLQSCEPCRISKIRCDHRSPVCSRCIARGTEKGCTYHPAPLTKPPRKATDVLTEATSASLSVLSSPAASRNGSGHTPADTEAEFLGSTCFSAVIEDDKDVVDMHTGQGYNRRFLPDIDNGSNPISEEQIVAGIDVLKLFLELPDMVALIQRAYDLCFTYMVPRSITMACATSIHGMFHGPAVKPGKKQLRRLVLNICENTYKPLALFPSIGAKDYHTLFTGPNLRWEIVGYILALLGRALQLDLKRGAEIHSTSSRKEAWRSKAHGLLEAVGYCSTICDSGNSVSHQSLWLLYGEAHLKNVVFGDMGYQVWRSMGDLTSMYYALGLHQDSVVTQNMPFYQYELRRRYASKLYCEDKVFSTLLGRPPRISGRYSSDIMCADISDAVLYLEDAELEKALENLNEDGWSKDGTLRTSTVKRMQLIVSRFREEVLEICLGADRDDIYSEGLAVLSRHETAWNQIPSYLRYDEITGSENVSPTKRYIMMALYMEQNNNRFLLHRKFVKQNQSSWESLLRISRSQLSTALRIIALSDQISDMHREISWFILYYGLPGASILAVELLKQTTQPQSPSDRYLDLIPRAEVIRNLSVLVSHLERAVRLEDGNSNSCKWAHRVLSCILDQIIDPQHHHSVTETAEEQMVVDNAAILGSAAADRDPLNIDQFLTWVEEADWNYDSSTFMI